MAIIDFAPIIPIISPFLISTVILAAIFAGNTFRIYKKSGLNYLLGIVIGFSLLSLSDLLFVLSLDKSFGPIASNWYYWLKIVSLSFGFVFIALSYHYKFSEQNATPLLLKITGVSVGIVLTIFVIIYFLGLAENLPYFITMSKYFRILNLAALGYIFRNTITSSVIRNESYSTYVPTAFGIMFLGQFSGLIFTIDQSFSAYIAAHAAKAVALAILVYVAYNVSKLKGTVKLDDT